MAEEFKIYTDQDADLSVLKGRKIGVIGYGSQGCAQALMMRDSGLDVIIGLHPGKSWKNADSDGFKVSSVKEAAKQADIIHILLPDEVHGDVYTNEIEENVVSGKVLSFSHGFSIVFGQIKPPEGVDVIMVAPKGPGSEMRTLFLEGKGMPASISIYQDASGMAKDIALAMCKAMKFTLAGVMECSFHQETVQDLFGEQTVLCGGMIELVKTAFQTLVDAGYPPELVYFDCLNEVRFIANLITQKGIAGMYDKVSNTAEYGGRTVGPQIIDEKIRDKMKQVLVHIESGEFAKEWLKEYREGMPVLTKLRENDKKLILEKVGEKIRNLFFKR